MNIAIIGMGYVGLPLAVEAAKAGFKTFGIELNADKVAAINRGESYIPDVPASILKKLVSKEAIVATTDFNAIQDSSVIIICVPTPLRKTRDPDISYIVSAVDEIIPRLKKGHMIILESTTYPGTTDEMILPALEESGLKAGKDFFLAFSPERVDPGNPKYGTKNTPKIVGGVTPACTKKIATVYRKIFDTVVTVSSSQCAEMVKLLENTFRSVNIGLVNEVALMCDRLGLDVWEVIDAAATKPFGFMPFYPGPGLGGHCIPIDPHYLSWKLKTLNYYAKFIELASEINSNMPRYVVDRIAQALNRQGKPLMGSSILVLGAAYKRDVGDLRESPALDIINLLISSGSKVVYYDPYIPAIEEANISLRSVNLSVNRLRRTDCVVIVTNHSCFDYEFIAKHARLIFDCRNAMNHIKTSTPMEKI